MATKQRSSDKCTNIECTLLPRLAFKNTMTWKEIDSKLFTFIAVWQLAPCMFMHPIQSPKNMTGSLIEFCKRRWLSIPDAYIENIITRKRYLPLYHDVHFSFIISRVEYISRKVVKRLSFVEKSKRVVPTMSHCVYSFPYGRY